jgi:hypothetical protein
MLSKGLTFSCMSQIRTKAEGFEALEKMYQLAQPIIDTIGLKDQESIHFYFGENYELVLFAKQIKGKYFNHRVKEGSKGFEGVHTGLTIAYQEFYN